MKTSAKESLKKAADKQRPTCDREAQTHTRFCHTPISKQKHISDIGAPVLPARQRPSATRRLRRQLLVGHSVNGNVPPPTTSSNLPKHLPKHGAAPTKLAGRCAWQGRGLWRIAQARVPTRRRRTESDNKHTPAPFDDPAPTRRALADVRRPHSGPMPPYVAHLCGRTPATSLACARARPIWRSPAGSSLLPAAGRLVDAGRAVRTPSLATRNPFICFTTPNRVRPDGRPPYLCLSNMT